jgi:outer membrane protein assembly factor BamB
MALHGGHFFIRARRRLVRVPVARPAPVIDFDLRICDAAAPEAWRGDHLYFTADGDVWRSGFGFESPTCVLRHGQASDLHWEQEFLVLIYDPDGERCELLRIDPDTGAVVWRFSEGNGPASACVLPGEAVFGCTEASQIYWLDTNTGRVRWRHPVDSLLGPSKPGRSASARLWHRGGGRLVAGSDIRPCIAALNESTGELIWRYRMEPEYLHIGACFVRDGIAYALAFPYGGIGSRLCALDLATGEELYRQEGFFSDCQDIRHAFLSGPTLVITGGQQAAIFDVERREFTFRYKAKRNQAPFSGWCRPEGDRLYCPAGLHERIANFKLVY